MPSYATQILPEDRWAVVHYVRALERSHAPAATDTVRATAPATADTASGSHASTVLRGETLTRAEGAR